MKLFAIDAQEIDRDTLQLYFGNIGLATFNASTAFYDALSNDNLFS